MSQIELSGFYATVAGGVLWSLVTIMGVILAPKFNLNDPDSTNALQKSVVNGIAAVFSSGIAGWFVDPALLSHFKVKDMATVNIIGLAIGLVFWPVLPGVIQLMEKFTLSSFGAWISGLQGKTNK